MLSHSHIRIGTWKAGMRSAPAQPGELQLTLITRGQMGRENSEALGMLRAGWARLEWQPAPASLDSESNSDLLRADCDSEVVVATMPAIDLVELAPPGPERQQLLQVLESPFLHQLPMSWEDRTWAGALAAHDLPCRARDLWTRLRLAEFLLRTLLPGKEQHIEPAADRINRAQTWIEARLDQPLDQNALAEHLACSSRSLRRWLREQLDLAPTQWQRLLRLQRAATLLGEGWGAAEAGLEVGYPNAAHFSNLFKLHYGCPPSGYRRRGA